MPAHRDYWDAFYGSDTAAAVPAEPSAFAVWVQERLDPDSTVVDVGCGTARDALWFAGRGHRVLGLDYAPSAVAAASAAAGARGVRASFAELDLYDAAAVDAAARRVGTLGPTVVYGRFLVHALEDPGRHHLWAMARQGLATGGRMYVEFRTGKDAAAEHEFGEHFRQFLDPAVVVGEIEALGGRVEVREEGHGLAVYRHEDPHVCRLVVTWAP